MLKIPYFVVDSFISPRPFTGNPAGVCPLEVWMSDGLLQAVAAELNLSETAFFVKERDAVRIRWFSPVAEAELCGHATLAAAHVIYEVLGRKEPSVPFLSRRGLLPVEWEGSRLIMDFPALPMTPADLPPALLENLGKKPRAVFRSMDWVCVYNDEESVRNLTPRLESLNAQDLRGVVVTAPGKDCDFVLRCFAPKLGIPEDPVTGSALSMLAPFWAARLEKRSMRARQLSKRGGEMECAHVEDRVKIAGRARVFSRGEISLMDA